MIWWLWHLIYQVFILLLYEDVPVFACFTHFFFSPDTFSSVTSFCLSNDLFILIHIWKNVHLNRSPILGSCSHVQGAEKSLSSELRDVGSSRQCRAEPAHYEASRSAHKPRSTGHQELKTTVAEVLGVESRQTINLKYLLHAKWFKIASSSVLWRH